MTDLELDTKTEEVFRFLGGTFDVRHAKTILVVTPREPVPFAVESAKSLMGMIHTEPSRVTTADTKFPIILATFGDGSVMPIDGWHRLAAAMRDQAKTVPAYALTADETLRIIRPRHIAKQLAKAFGGAK